MSLIFGAGGVAREVAWLLHSAQPAQRDGAGVKAFVSSDVDWTPDRDIDGIPVISESHFLETAHEATLDVYIAIGQPSAKARVVGILDAYKPRYPSLVHSAASFDSRPGKLTVGKGSVIYPHALLSTEVRIGDFVHINPGASLAHHASIGAFTTICPGAVIAGNVNIGSRCFIGAGAIVRDGTCIADDCIIGAGAVVVSDIHEPGTWIGVPARRRP